MRKYIVIHMTHTHTRMPFIKVLHTERIKLAYKKVIGLLTVLNIDLSKDKHGNKFPLYRIILNQYPNQPLATNYNQLHQCITSSIPFIFICLVAESFLFIYHLLIPLSCSVRSKRRMSWHNCYTFAMERCGSKYGY